MTRPALLRFLLLAAAAVGLTGGVVAWAAGDREEADPAPPRADADVPGVVSLARPVAPVRVGSRPRGVIELRIVEPDGRRRAVLAFRDTRSRGGRTIGLRCAIAGDERQLRTLERLFGTCSEAGAGADAPWTITTGSGSDGRVTIDGLVSRRVERLTVAGPGGTFVVPTSQSGAFLVAYGRRATGRAVLTATLDDGSKRFFRTEIPPSRRSPGAVEAPDPGGLPSWSTTGETRRRGPRAGQTCVQVTQDVAIRKRGREQGGSFLAPACGDLRRHAVFARTVRTAPSRRLRTFGGGPNVPRRTVLVGAVAKDVRAVAVVGPDGRRELPLADAGRAFLAVFPPRVAPAQLTLETTRVDGRVERYRDPVAVNRATTDHPPPGIVGRLRLRLDASAPRRVVLQITLTGSAKRVRATFLGREVRLRPVAGAASRREYQGVYDGTRGVTRPLRRGAIQRSTLLVCGDTCSTELQRARLR